jgi:enterochelin esterase-like enzyme
MERQAVGVGRWVRVPGRGRRAAAAIGVAAVTFLLLRSLGILDGTDSALQIMGFDIDRAKLLTALTGEAIVVSAAVLATRATLASSIAGMAAGAGVFARTFVNETDQATAARPGSASSFDAIGWVVTVVTLVAALAIVAWASATISLHVRAGALDAARDLRIFGRERRDPRRLVRPAGVVATLAVLLVALPAFGDMVNYAPDARMHRGGATEIGLVGTGTNGSSGAGPATPIASLPPGVLDEPTILSGRTGGAGAVLATSRPWAAWAPTGTGTTATATFPAPWVGGSARQVQISIYLPPGYATSTHPDPVIYEAPFQLGGGWTKEVGITSLLDGLIDSGRIPPTIAVFIETVGGPYPDAECANSYDRREWVDRYVVQTIVPYIDRTYRTIPSAEARALLGFSQGGFCAAMLQMQHPDVFASAIAMSGYYQAGLQSGQTVEAGRVFGTSVAYRDANSPDVLAARMGASVARTLFVELNANPAEPIYGPQYAGFAAALHAAGVPVALFPTPFGHAWSSVRDEVPQLLMTLAERWSAVGLFA